MDLFLFSLFFLCNEPDNTKTTDKDDSNNSNDYNRIDIHRTRFFTLCY